MIQILSLILYLFGCLPDPVRSVILLVILIGVLIMLLELIKLILDAIPFV